MLSVAELVAFARRNQDRICGQIYPGSRGQSAESSRIPTSPDETSNADNGKIKCGQIRCPTTGRGLNVCPDCGRIMQYSEDESYECVQCGICRPAVGDSPDRWSASTSLTWIRMAGKDGASFKSVMSACSGGGCSKDDRGTIYKEYCTYCKEHDDITAEVLEFATDWFLVVGSREVHRATVRLKIMAACLYYACHSSGIARQTKEIAGMFGLPEPNFSGGMKIVEDAIAKNEIIMATKDTEHTNEEQGYTVRYLHNLSLPTEYYNLIVSIIHRAEKKRIQLKMSISSRVAGAISIVVERIGNTTTNITNLDIKRQCGVEVTTILKFANSVNANKVMFAREFKVIDRYARAFAFTSTSTPASASPLDSGSAE